jgi:hypothetical protein
MAWEPALVKDDDSPLGTPDEVRQAISLAFPSTEWQLAPGGEELVKQMQQYGSPISDEWRAMMLQTLPHWQGIYDTEAVTVEFDLGSGGAILFVSISSHGEHAEAQKRLRALARDRGWVLKRDYEE